MKTADELAREERERLERLLLESLQAYDRTATRKLREWGIADRPEEAA